MSSEDPTKISTTFNFGDHDILIRSCDKVDFKVHKIMLKHASEVWSTMLSLPAESSNSRGSSSDDVQVMELAEDANAIDTLLRFIYPVVKPVADTFEACTSALEIAAKYEVSVAVQLLSQAIIAHGIIEQYPMRIFAVATRYELEDVKKLAYQQLLTFNFITGIMPDKAPELASLSALDYHILCRKKVARSNVAISIVEETDNFLKGGGVPFCQSCGRWCWLIIYQKLVSERLRDNATSSALYFHEEDLAQVMKGLCSRGSVGGGPTFIHTFYEMQRSEAFREVVRQIDNLP